MKKHCHILVAGHIYNRGDLMKKTLLNKGNLIETLHLDGCTVYFRDAYIETAPEAIQRRLDRIGEIWAQSEVAKARRLKANV